MEMVIWRPGACRRGLLVVPEELCGILERGTGMGVSGCLGCQGAGAVSVDLHMVLLFIWYWCTWLPPVACRSTAELDLCHGIANAQRYRKVSEGRGPCCDLETTKCSEVYRNWEAFSM